MIMKMCSIHDGKAEAWMNPMYFQSSGQAVRSFQDVVNDPESDYFKHPEDYSIFELGEFDPREGKIVLLGAPLHLASAINLTNGGKPE